MQPSLVAAALDDCCRLNSWSAGCCGRRTVNDSAYECTLINFRSRRGFEQTLHCPSFASIPSCDGCSRDGYYILHVCLDRPLPRSPLGRALGLLYTQRRTWLVLNGLLLRHSMGSGTIRVVLVGSCNHDASKLLSYRTTRRRNLRSLQQFPCDYLQAPHAAVENSEWLNSFECMLLWTVHCNTTLARTVILGLQQTQSPYFTLQEFSHSLVPVLNSVHCTAGFECSLNFIRLHRSARTTHHPATAHSR